MLFRDRKQGGRVLAVHLNHYANRPNVIVLALPRGGVPVGYEIATALDVPMDVFLVRKLGVPNQEELAMGAIASGGVRVLNEDVVQALHLSPELIDTVATEEQHELERRERAYRDDRPQPEVRGRIVILADDGLATGSSMRAAIKALRLLEPARIIVAVPVGARQTCEELRREADEVVCARMPEPFYAVGAWYADFAQTTDAEVYQLLQRAAERNSAPGRMIASRQR
jgi:predicted phosphoribosyltransferase